MGIGLLLGLGKGRVALLGVTLGALLHLMIAMTPPPNNIGTFSFGCLVRLFLWVPRGAEAAMAELELSFAEPESATFEAGTYGFITMAFGLLLCAITALPRREAGNPTDHALIACCFAVALLMRAVMIELTRPVSADPVDATAPSDSLTPAGRAGRVFLCFCDFQ